jgi:hypothetical protein
MHFDIGGQRGSYKENRLSNLGVLPSPAPPNASPAETPAARRLAEARARLAPGWRSEARRLAGAADELSHR